MNHQLYQFRLQGFTLTAKIAKMGETEERKLKVKKDTAEEINTPETTECQSCGHEEVEEPEGLYEELKDHGIDLDEKPETWGSLMFFCSCGKYWCITDHENKTHLLSEAVKHADKHNALVNIK